ncbi:hypothetical protein Nepgr_000555 [Nepenthes gracilis]|uniref:ENTH domain-containing protein n=1 Tax=Nepenthes gracilis TaxID=150966 RepID=A0AAD3RWK3_NEPGR|nr:hypothetical protein Nepgr_000555 [Nepenthes gracilis]
MPSKLRQAIEAVKDQTSISIARVKISKESSNLEVAILRATTHDEGPIDERYVTEVLQHVSANKSYAAACARAIGRRIGRTRKWVVAVKSLMLVLRLFQDGDPHFPTELLHAMQRGYKILNLSSFRDDSSTSCPWDFTAFVRTFALYLDERLDCFVTGKLQRRMDYRERPPESSAMSQRMRTSEPIRDMKPVMLLDKISYWQRLLDRAIAMRPTGAARTNSLAQSCLYAVVQESFHIYRDISNGLALILDNFFHLQYHSCVIAVQTCVKASKQFEELCSFYDLCKGVGVGRTSEYPSVQKVSEELVEALQEFTKDQSSFSSNGRALGARLLLPASRRSRNGGSSSGRGEPLSDRIDQKPEHGSLRTSLDDLISADAETTPVISFDRERYSDAVDKHSQMEDFFSTNDDVSALSDLTDGRNNSVLDPSSLDEQDEKQCVKAAAERPKDLDLKDGSTEGWELVLLATVTQSSQAKNNSNVNGCQAEFLNGFSAESSLPRHRNNPFLQDAADLPTENHDLFTAYAQNMVGTKSSAGVNDVTAANGTGQAGVPMDLFAGVGNSNAISANGGATALQPDFGNANGQASYPANFNNCSGVTKSNNLADFSAGLGNAQWLRSFPANYFGDNFDNRNGNGNFSARFSADFGYANGATCFPANYANGSTSFRADFDGNNGSGIAITEPTFHAGFDTASTASAIVPFGFAFNHAFSSSVPTCRTAPTFRAANPEVYETSLQNEYDPFGPFSSNTQMVSEPAEQRSLQQQQRLW